MTNLTDDNPAQTTDNVETDRIPSPVPSEGRWSDGALVPSPRPPRRWASQISATFSRLRSLPRHLNMFRNGTKRTNEDRKVKEAAASSSSKTGTTRSSSYRTATAKVKTWRRIKPKKSSKESDTKMSTQATTDVNSSLDKTTDNESEIETNAEEPQPGCSKTSDTEAAVASSNEQETSPPDSDTKETLPVEKNADVEVKNGSTKTSEPPPPPPPKAQASVRIVEPPAKTGSRKTSKVFVTKKTSSSLSKSEPALNVYLHQRQVVSKSKFVLNQKQPKGPEKMSRYQKLARDTKLLVARLSGEIPSTEKIRQALKLPPSTAGTKLPKDIDITDPDFTCDEQTAAILLAELEGKKPGSSNASATGEASGPSNEKDMTERSQNPRNEKLKALFEDINAKEANDLGAEGVDSRWTDKNKDKETMDSFVKAHRFAQLRSLYRSLERMGQLEKTISTSDLSRLSSDGVIDFDLWRRLRQREKAEAEMRNLSSWIKTVQKDGDCFFTAKEPTTVKWKGDAGLRVKDKSVQSLAEKFKSPGSYATRSLPRNFASATMPRRPNLACKSTLTNQQMSSLKTQLSQVYANQPSSLVDLSQFEISVPAADNKQGQAAHLYVRSASDSSRDNISQLENKQMKSLETNKSLSISGVGPNVPPRALKVKTNDALNKSVTANVIRRSQSAATERPVSLTETEKQNLSSRLSAELSEKYLSHRPAEPRSNSTRAAIQYVQQLSESLSRNVGRKRDPSPDALSDQCSRNVSLNRENSLAELRMRPGQYSLRNSRTNSRNSSRESPRARSTGCKSPEELVRRDDSRDSRVDSRMSSSSRDSSTSGQSQRDYLLVLTSAPHENIDDVESVVKEWAAIQSPAVPKRSSSLCYELRDEDSQSSNSSVQTVIHRDVHDKVKFFEKVITQSSPNRRALTALAHPIRIVRSVSDLRTALEDKCGERSDARSTRQTNRAPKRSQTLPSRKSTSSSTASGIIIKKREPDAKNVIEKHERALSSRTMSAFDSMKDLRQSQLISRLKTQAAEPTESDEQRYGRTYLNLVKKGEVVKKCQYFNQHSDKREGPSARKLLSRRRSLPLLIPVKACHSKTVIKTQEVGDVRSMKRRYEEGKNRSKRSDKWNGFFKCTSTPALDGKVGPHFSWTRRFGSGNAKKQVSFPNIVFPPVDQLSSRRPSDDLSGQRRSAAKKMIDFTRVKPTLLSSARLALRQAQSTPANSPPTSTNKKISYPRVDRQRITRSTPTWYSDVHCSPTAFAEHRSVFSPAPPHNRSTGNLSVTSDRAVTSPTGTLNRLGSHWPIGHSSQRSSIVSPVLSNRSNSDAAPADKSKSSAPAATQAQASGKTLTSSGAKSGETDDADRKSSKESDSKTSIPPKVDSSTVNPVASGSATSSFDPTLHQPKFRYTPTPPSIRSRIYDLYATYPRRRGGYRPPRPPLPANLSIKVDPLPATAG